jgi:hypothetical protein
MNMKLSRTMRAQTEIETHSKESQVIVEILK